MIDSNVVEHLVAVWFIDGQGVNWMATVFRNKGDPTVRFRYRFRYDSGTNDPFDGRDTKRWWAGTAGHMSEAELVTTIDSTAQVLALRMGGKVDRVDVGGPVEVLLEKAKGRPWLHFKRADAGAKPS